MPTNPDKDDFLEDDGQDELTRRSIFSAGWFRALLVLTVLAIVVVVSLPYLLNWLEPTSAPPVRTQAKSGVPAPAAPATSPSAPTAGTPSPPAPAKVEAPAPAPPAVKQEAPRPAPAPAAKPSPAVQAEAPKASPAPKRSPAPEGGSPGSYWVQVGAFLEARNAEALAKQLRSQNFPVQISAVTRGGGGASAPARPPSGQNQLFITDSTPDAVNAALKGKGTAQAVKGGVTVNPPFDLETAMALSSTLKREGFTVVIQRAKPAPANGGEGGATYHLVRVGGYADRAKAQQARGELQTKGHPGFLTQGAAR